MIWRAIWHMQVVEIVFAVLLVLVLGAAGALGIREPHGTAALLAAVALFAAWIGVYRLLYKHW